MPRVFICYSRKDSEFVDKLTADLKAAGVPTWRDVDEIPEDEASNTTSWRRAVDRALVECTHMVVVLSPDAVESPEVEAEWNDFVGRGLPVFPVKCRETRVPYRLNSLNWVDLREGYDEKITKLAERINRAVKTGKAPEQVETKVIALANDDVDIVTITVSKLGRGQYRTIGEAIEAAPEGARILVKSGHYDENVIITKSVEIIGDGRKEEVVIKSNEGACLKMETDYAEVHNLTMIGHGRSSYTIGISQGQLLLQSCDISNGRSCIEITGRGTNPIIRRCKIHDAKEAGILIFTSSRPLIENCEIVENQTGIEIHEAAVPTVRRCQIRMNTYEGVIVHYGAQGIVEECILSDNEMGAWRIGENNSLIRRNNIE